MANADHTDFSPYKQSRRLEIMLRMESELIKSKYKLIDDPICRNGTFFSMGSKLYSMIKNQIGDTSLNLSAIEKKYCLKKFQQFLTDDSSNIAYKFQHLDDQQKTRMGIF